MGTVAAASPRLRRLREAVLAMVRAPGQADLSARQLAVLLLVDAPGGPRTVRGLAAALELPKPTVTRAVDWLVALGLVARSRDSADGRSVPVAATTDGRTLCRRLAGAMAARPGGAA